MWHTVSMMSLPQNTVGGTRINDATANGRFSVAAVISAPSFLLQLLLRRSAANRYFRGTAEIRSKNRILWCSVKFYGMWNIVGLSHQWSKFASGLCCTEWMTGRQYGLYHMPVTCTKYLHRFSFGIMQAEEYQGNNEYQGDDWLTQVWCENGCMFVRFSLPNVFWLRVDPLS